MVPRGRRALRAGRGRRVPEGDRDDGRDHRAHRRAHGRRSRLRARRRRLLPRRELPGVRRAVGPAPRPDGGLRAEPAQGRSARLRALEGEQAGRGHRLGLALGAWPARLAHRVLGDGARELGPEFWIHGGGLDIVFPHHENELAQSRSVGHPFARIWAHNGMLRFTGEKMSKSVGNVETIRDVLDRWGSETMLALLPHRALAQAARLLGRDDGRGCRAGRDLRNALRGEERGRRANGRGSRRRSRTTSTRRQHSRCFTTSPARARSAPCDVGSTSSASVARCVRRGVRPR